MKKIKNEKEFIILIITILFVSASFYTYYFYKTNIDKKNPVIENKINETDNIRLDKNIQSDNDTITKSDYIGTWSDGRAMLHIEDNGKMSAKWSSNAIESTSWNFDCEYINNNGYMLCKNGIQTENFAICNGKEFYEVPDFDECSSKYPETINEGEKQIYSAASGRLIIEKGIPTDCDSFAEHAEKGIILKFYNDSVNNDSLESTCFAKSS